MHYHTCIFTFIIFSIIFYYDENLVTSILFAKQVTTVHKSNISGFQAPVRIVLINVSPHEIIEFFAYGQSTEEGKDLTIPNNFRPTDTIKHLT